MFVTNNTFELIETKELNYEEAYSYSDRCRSAHG